MVNGSSNKIYEVNTKVISNTLVNNNYKHLILSAPSKVLDIQPGQFFHLKCPNFEDTISFLRRPMSVYQYNKQQRKIEFLYKIQGKGTMAMSSLKHSDYFNIVGPLGKGFELNKNYKNILIVARGVGLATLAPLANLAFEKKINLTIICSARSKEYLMSLELFESLSSSVFTITDDDNTSSVDNLNRLINQFIKNKKVDAIFTCGSSRILKLLKDICEQYNIPGQVALEQQMACGIGMCFCCVKPFRINGEIVQKRVCNEGPVFNISEALPW
jgi:dihydroorotate dehydrogenase electron transfer subunit